MPSANESISITINEHIIESVSAQKHLGIKIDKHLKRKFIKGQIKICFGQLKILVRYLINISREDPVRPVCQLMIFPHFIPLCHII